VEAKVNDDTAAERWTPATAKRETAK
jgi:hypothetical protein